MPRRSLRFRSPVLLAGALLAFSLFTGCKQGVGDRCEIASDCASNFCIPCNSDPQNMFCADMANPVCPSFSSGVGGATASTGGTTGSGGGGAGGTDASADLSGADAETD